MSEPLTPGEVARHSRDGEGESEHFHEALSVSLSLDSSPGVRGFLLVKLEFIPTSAVWVETTNLRRPHARLARGGSPPPPLLLLHRDIEKNHG